MRRRGTAVERSSVRRAWMCSPLLLNQSFWLTLKDLQRGLPLSRATRAPLASLSRPRSRRGAWMARSLAGSRPIFRSTLVSR